MAMKVGFHAYVNGISWASVFHFMGMKFFFAGGAVFSLFNVLVARWL